MEIINYTNSDKTIRIDEYFKKNYPHVPVSVFYKTFRKRDIKVNGIRVNNHYLLKKGDIIEIYIDLGVFTKEIASVVYEDKNILIVNKPQGLAVQPHKDSHQTLIDFINNYYKEDRLVTPQLCHRIDRNTGGLVLIAKNKAIHDLILKEFNYVKKFYICYVYGIIKEKSKKLEAYLLKDSKNSRVSIFDKYVRNAKKIITCYNVLSSQNGISKLEVELISGRTHQIRAHMSHMGFPIVGDGKYGLNKINKSFGLKQQALWAYKLKFEFPVDSPLCYLNSKEIKANVDKNLFNIFKF